METHSPDNVTIRYTDSGTGNPPLLFIHGVLKPRTLGRSDHPLFPDPSLIAIDLYRAGKKRALRRRSGW